jgi:hypothetical protein
MEKLNGHCVTIPTWNPYHHFVLNQHLKTDPQRKIFPYESHSTKLEEKTVPPDGDMKAKTQET